MAKKAKNNKNILSVGLAVLTIFILFLFAFHLMQKGNSQSGSDDSRSEQNSVNRYHSNLLKITFDIPQGYSIKDEDIFITLKKNIGEITISRIGTNSDSLDGYLYDIADVNHLNITDKEDLTINGLPSIKADINGKMTYLFYKDNLVFSMETKSPQLYDDLDQIAKSFRYTP